MIVKPALAIVALLAALGVGVLIGRSMIESEKTAPTLDADDGGHVTLSADPIGLPVTKPVPEIEPSRAFAENLDLDIPGCFLTSPGPKFDVVIHEDFERYFERKAAGPRVADWQWDGETLLEDDTTVLLGPGIHRWDAAKWQAKFPEDLEFAGAGMDETLLRLSEIQSRGVRNLTFRDLTIDCDDNFLTDVRSRDEVTIHLVRCRVVGFDIGRDESVMIAAEWAAVWAEQCRFEAGYGRSPGSGVLFRVRMGLFVRMQDCVIRGPFKRIYDNDQTATYLFTSCAFEEMDPANPLNLEVPPPPVRYENCTIAYSDPLPPKAKRVRKKLTDINPAWK